jgi:hypothetical protein
LTRAPSRGDAVLAQPRDAVAAGHAHVRLIVFAESPKGFERFRVGHIPVRVGSVNEPCGLAHWLFDQP